MPGTSIGHSSSIAAEVTSRNSRNKVPGTSIGHSSSIAAEVTSRNSRNKVPGTSIGHSSSIASRNKVPGTRCRNKVPGTSTGQLATQFGEFNIEEAYMDIVDEDGDGFGDTGEGFIRALGQQVAWSATRIASPGE